MSFPLAREKVLARIKSYNFCWKIGINDWREYNGCAITSWHESSNNEAELCKRLHCTEEKVRLLTNSNPVTLLDVIYFFLTIVILMHSFTNQVNGVLVQKKDGKSCIANPNGHCCNVQTNLN